MSRNWHPVQRISEMIDPNAPHNRKSRLDAPKRSFIPRPGSKGGSMDRVSGVYPLESSRHRSADGIRPTSLYRPQSVPRPSAQMKSRSTVVGNTPSQMTPMSHRDMRTPRSTMSNYTGGHRTPSNERKKRGRLSILETGIIAVPTKDRRNLLDANWQKKTNQRLVAWLRANPETAVLLSSSAAPLRPATISLFIELVNCLVPTKKWQVNSSNYVDKLPVIARKLLYPGAMTKSWLKSVNAMHTFSQTVAFLSYLVDLNDINDILAKNMTLEKLYGCEERAILKHNFYFNCWNEYQVQGDIEPIKDEYIEALKEHYGVSDNMIRKLCNKIEEAKALLNNPRVLEAKKHEEEVKAKHKSMEEHACVIRERNDTLVKELQQTKQVLSDSQEELKKTKEIGATLEQEIKALRSKLEVQKMSVRDRDELAAEAERINAATDSKQVLITDMEKMVFKQDLCLAKAQKQALITSVDVNRALVSVGLETGHNLTKYVIEERELLAGNTPEVIRKAHEALKQLAQECEARLQEAKQNKQTSRVHLIQIEMESERECVEMLRVELNQASKQSKELQESSIKAMTAQQAIAQEARVTKEKAANAANKAHQTLEETRLELEQWKERDIKWRNKLEELQNEEYLVRENCKKRAEDLLQKYVTIAQSLLPKNVVESI